MNILEKKQMRRNRIIFFIMNLLVIFINIKYVFIDLCIDSTYQVSMSYRLVTGDLLFKEMWEVHQTSAFLCAFFIKIYMFLFKTTTGIVLFLQFVSVLIDGAIAYLIYHVVYKCMKSKAVSVCMAWVFFIVSPKDVPIAEFANMQIWFSMLMCIMFFLLDKTGKKRYLFLAAISLCLTILSYPSCLIMIFGIGCVFYYRKQIKDFLMFTCICIICGVLYLANILRYMKVDELLTTVRNMLSIEPTHTVSLSDKFLAYAFDFMKYAIVIAVLYMISWLITFFVCRIRKDNISVKKILTDIIFCVLAIVISIYAVGDWKHYPRGFYSISFVAIILVGFKNREKVNEKLRWLYVYGTVVSFMNFVSTLLLTDLELITVVPYLLIGLVVALLPLSEMFKEINLSINVGVLKKTFIILFAFLLIFKGVYIIRPIYEWIAPITDVRGVVKKGPAKGIISEYMGPYMQNESINEWEQYIPDESRIYIIGGGIDTLGYLYGDTIVAAPTVMSTPGYNESIAKYWEDNSEKYPDIVIASCWYGELDKALQNNDWIMKWLEEEFKPAYYIDGKYWRYYFR